MRKECPAGPLFVGLGEVLFDCLPGGARFGGAPANFACAARSLGFPAAVVSAVGGDTLGCRARRVLRDRGVMPCLVRRRAPTGTVAVTLDGVGVPSYVFRAHPAYESVPWTGDMEALARRTAVCAFGTLAQCGRETRRTVRRFLRALPPSALRVYDVNLRETLYSRDIILSSLALADAVKCSDEELPVLAALAGVGPSPEAYYGWLRRRGTDCLIYTEGARGSRLYHRGMCTVEPARAVVVVDTVGAGDAFTAALAAAWRRGLGDGAAHAFAAEAAAFVCTRDGAAPEFPPSLTALLPG